ncbi:hypothetical protein ACT4ML_14460 [Natrinema sp. LN54]|uniref:hypothetical protein n=1 Tax=Natrinema sp. LN54 TaxID=3458705 RepID=UPI004035460A
MTESTTDNPGDGALEVGSSVDDLFGDVETGGDSGDERRDETADGDRADDGSDGIEDRTAADIFDQLRADAADEGGADDVLADESPDDIIASADEPDPEPATPVDDELLADDDELTDLLLTGRTKDREFLWIDPNASDDSRDGETSDSAAPEEGTDAVAEEPSAVESDAETENDAPVWDGDVDEATASDTEAVDEPSESDSGLEIESDDGLESDAADTTDVTAEDTTAAADTDDAPEAEPDSSTDAVADDDRDDLEDDTAADDGDDAGLETSSDIQTAGDATIDDGDDAETETETAPDQAEAAADDDADATAADDPSSGPLGRLRSTLGGLF